MFKDNLIQLRKMKKMTQEVLAEKVGVGAVPGSSFFNEAENRYIRFHFAKKDETLLAALDRLADIRKKLG